MRFGTDNSAQAELGAVTLRRRITGRRTTGRQARQIDVLEIGPSAR